MNIVENIRLASKAIRTNLLRTILTCAIIATGIAALVGILTTIDALEYSFSSNFSGIGTNSFKIRRARANIQSKEKGVQKKRGPIINFDDATSFKEQYDYPSKVCVYLYCTSTATVKSTKEKTNPNVVLYGGNEHYLESRGYELSEGRNFTEGEVTNGRNIAIIGAGLVKKLFKGNAERALHKVINIKGVKYTVIGVLASKGATMSNNDRVTIIPLMTAKRFYGTEKSNYSVVVNINKADQMDESISHAIGTFRNVRQLKASEENNFEISKSDAAIKWLRENTLIIRLAAVFIALITLLGAAVGLMNIMLVSVTERTKEIGLCKAIGANRTTVLIQFLVEAIFICQLGGFLGILLGMLFGNAVGLYFGTSFLIPWNWISIGILVCFIVGLISGIYPAIKASRLDPIEALRYE